MEETIYISELNDYIFCPISIYFHGLYGEISKLVYQDECQVNGTKAHENIDNNKYSSKRNILQGISVFSNTYNITGKIDIFNIEKGLLIERKNVIRKIYDGYIFQVYAQYFALTDMGYIVNEIKLFSLTDNKNYKVDIPKENEVMFNKFLNLLNEIKNFDYKGYQPDCLEKCKNCIYSNLCDRSLVNDK